MTILKKIKEAQLAARKSKDKFTSNILTTLVSEVAMVGKNNSNVETSDEDALKIITKFLKNTNTNIDLVTDEGKITELMREASIYEGYLPKQMTKSELEVTISVIIEEGASNIGMVMKELNSGFKGMFNGKDAKIITLAVLEKSKG